MCLDEDSKRLRYPELQQYPVSWAGYKFWKWEDNFNLRNHIGIAARTIATRADITQLGEELMSGTFPDEASPWELTLIPGIVLEGEVVTIIFFRFHHLVCDGVAARYL